MDFDSFSKTAARALDESPTLESIRRDNFSYILESI